MGQHSYHLSFRWRRRFSLLTAQCWLAQVVQGKPLDGPGLADLIQQVVEGLNDRDIPTGEGVMALNCKVELVGHVQR
jgi:hypothetical protein